MFLPPQQPAAASPSSPYLQLLQGGAQQSSPLQQLLQLLQGVQPGMGGSSLMRPTGGIPADVSHGFKAPGYGPVDAQELSLAAHSHPGDPVGVLHEYQAKRAFRNAQTPPPEVAPRAGTLRGEHISMLGGAAPKSLTNRNMLNQLARAKAVAQAVQHLRRLRPAQGPHAGPVEY